MIDTLHGGTYGIQKMIRFMKYGCLILLLDGGASLHDMLEAINNRNEKS